MANKKITDLSQAANIEDNDLLIAETSIGTRAVPYSVLKSTFPASLPASDVYDWAKAENKPSYTASEIGADASGSSSTALSDAKNYTDEKISDLINGAPETLDTLKEISDAITEHGEVTDALNAAIGNKLGKTDDTANNTITFESDDNSNPVEYSDVTTLSSGEKHSSIFNKVSTMFKNIRYIYNLLGTTDISTLGDGTVTNALTTLNDTKFDKSNISNSATVTEEGYAADARLLNPKNADSPLYTFTDYINKHRAKEIGTIGTIPTIIKWLNETSLPSSGHAHNTFMPEDVPAYNTFHNLSYHLLAFGNEGDKCVIASAYSYPHSINDIFIRYANSTQWTSEWMKINSNYIYAGCKTSYINHIDSKYCFSEFNISIRSDIIENELITNVYVDNRAVFDENNRGLITIRFIIPVVVGRYYKFSGDISYSIDTSEDLHTSLCMKWSNYSIIASTDRNLILPTESIEAETDLLYLDLIIDNNGTPITSDTLNRISMTMQNFKINDKYVYFYEN